MKYWLLLLLLLVLPVASANWDANLHAVYTFDDEANPFGIVKGGYNASGTGISGAIRTNVTTVLGGGALNLTASNAYVNFTNLLLPRYNSTNPAVTLSIWAYSTAGGQQQLISNCNAGASGWAIEKSTTNKVRFIKCGVGAGNDINGGTWLTGSWTHIVAILNTSGMYVYQNDSFIVNGGTSAASVVSTSVRGTIGTDGTLAQYFKGYVDEVYIWNRTLNTTEISELWNGGAGYNPFSVNTSTVGYINVSSAVYTGDRLTTFNLLFSDGVLNYPQTFPFNLTTPTEANWTFLSTGQQTELCIITPYPIAINGSVEIDFVYNQNKTNSSLLPVGSYTLTGSATSCGITRSVTLATSTGFYNTTNGTIFIPNTLTNLSNFTIYAYSNISHFNTTFTNYNLSRNLTFNYTVLKLNGTDYVTGYPVVNYSVALNSTTNSYASTQTAVNQSASFFTDNNLSLFLHYAKAGYISNFTTPTGLLDGVYNYTLYFYPNNSVLFSIFNSTNLVPTTGTLVDVSLTGGGNNTYYSSTTNGSLFFEGLQPDTYTIDAQAPGFGTFTGSLIIGSNTFQTYSIYLPPLEGTNTIFSIQDFSGGNPIAGATMVTEYKPTLNSSFVNIGSYTSDVTGSILLYYTPGAHYRFTLSAPSYQTRQFELDPIIFSTYDITLTRNVTTNITDDFDSITITIAPSIVYNARTNNFTFYVATPLGNLQGFNYSIWSDANTTRLSGLTTSAYGGTLTAPYYVNASARGEKVYIEYTYYLTSGTVKTYLRVYPIIDYNAYTFNQVRDADNYGLPLFDRMFIVMMVLLFSAGFAFAFGGEVVAGFISILVLVYFSFIGFIPLWFSALATFVIIWFIWSRS